MKFASILIFLSMIYSFVFIQLSISDDEDDVDATIGYESVEQICVRAAELVAARFN